MADEERPIAWLALSEGTTVYASDGEELGKVSTVIADEGKDIFSGIAFKHGLLGQARFAPAELVDEITTDAVHLNVASPDAEALEPYEG